MGLNHNITQIEYGDWRFKGNNTVEVMLDMKIQIDASLRDIAHAFNVSHETVNLYFKHYRDNYPDHWADIESKKQFYDNFKQLWYDNVPMVDIIQKLHINKGKYETIERRLIPKKERLWRVSRPLRMNNLAHSLFDYQFDAGDNFQEYVEKLFKKHLADDERQLLVDYYFNNEKQDDKIRFKRVTLLKKVKKEMNVNLNELERNGVLCRNQKL